jgi:hypothetical protein
MILSAHNERNDAYGMALSASRHLAFRGYRNCLNHGQSGEEGKGHKDKRDVILNTGPCGWV